MSVKQSPKWVLSVIIFVSLFLFHGCQQSNPTSDGDAITPLCPVTDLIPESDYHRILYVSDDGEDSAENGSKESPFESIEFALQQITNASADNRFAIMISQGGYSDETIILKDYVDMYGGFKEESWERNIQKYQTVLDGDEKRRILIAANHTKIDGFFFTDGVIPAQFRVGSRGLKPGKDYSWPLQLILSDKTELVKMIPDLTSNWMLFNNFSVEDLFVRTEEAALDLFINGRKNTSLWNPDIGYKLEEGDPESNFVYLGEQPLSAYFEYLLYEKLGDHLWRKRCIEQMNFILQGQNTYPGSVNYGVIHTTYDLEKRCFDSDDRGINVGFKPDLNAYMARYMLMTWQRVKENEGVDHQDWYQAAVCAADWVMRQRNADGGLPQVVRYPFVYMENEEDTTDKSFHKSISSTPGRALAAFPVIYNITGDKRYLGFSLELEAFVRRDVEGRLRFTGHHPDLPPDELEEASIWGVIEYWLDKYDRTGEAECLERAIADAYLSFLWWCPKQLSWVQNPTQCASAEQQHFLQYSIYCYQNRKLECLWRLFNHTKKALFAALYHRVLQGIFWTQIDRGDLKGAAHERIADPWLARHDYDEKADFNSMGTIYMGEQILDTLLQIVEIR